MFGIGETELVIIVGFAFLVFGPDKLPGMGRTIGRALRQFREAQEGFTQVVQAEVVDPLTGAMNAPASSKRAQAASEAQAEDADRVEEGADAAAPQARQETFAERKARLQAEREARETAEAAGEDEASAPSEGSSDLDDDADLPSAPAPNADRREPPTSAAALYALGPRGGEEPSSVADASDEDGETPGADDAISDRGEARDAE